MSAQHIYDTAPLGSLIRFSNGEPQPPARFSRKLRAWSDQNGAGRLVERTPARVAATYRSPAAFCLRLGDISSQGVIMIVMRRLYTVDSAQHFEIVDTPKPGMVRVVTRSGGHEELRFLASDMVGAEQWMATNRYSDMVAEIVPDPDPVVLPSSFARAA